MREYQGKPFTYVEGGKEYKDYRLVMIHYIAKALGVHVHFQGYPYGSIRNNKLYRTQNETSESNR